MAEVEIKIRTMLLRKIRGAAPNNQEIQDFLTDENIKRLSERSDNELILRAVALFTEKDDTLQTAWRAYEPQSETVHWPNLLTAPKKDESDSSVFSTRATTDGSAHNTGTVTQKSASDDIRRLAAVCYQATQDEVAVPAAQKRQNLEDAFVNYIAEIRRAHNTNNSEIDNPSCYPGCVSRLGQIITQHPKFSRDEVSDETGVPQLVENMVRAALQEVTTQRLEQLEMDAERRLLLSAIHVYSQDSTEVITSSREGIYQKLTYTDEDLLDVYNVKHKAQKSQLSESETVEAEALYLQRVMAERTKLMIQLCGKTGDKLYRKIEAKLRHATPPVESNSIHYLLAMHLSNLPRLLSIPPELRSDVIAPVIDSTPELTTEPSQTESQTNPFANDPTLAKPYKKLAFDLLKQKLPGHTDEFLEDLVRNIFMGANHFCFRVLDKDGLTSHITSKDKSSILNGLTIPESTDNDVLMQAYIDIKPSLQNFDAALDASTEHCPTEANLKTRYNEQSITFHGLQLADIQYRQNDVLYQLGKLRDRYSACHKDKGNGGPIDVYRPKKLKAVVETMDIILEHGLGSAAATRKLSEMCEIVNERVRDDKKQSDYIIAKTGRQVEAGWRPGLANLSDKGQLFLEMIIDFLKSFFVQLAPTGDKCLHSVSDGDQNNNIADTPQSSSLGVGRRNNKH